MIMEQFEFAIDTKVTVWTRTKFSIEAESEEEAIEKAKEIFDGIDDPPYTEHETLYETEEEVPVEENEGQSTKELVLLDHPERTIYDNTKSSP